MPLSAGDKLGPYEILSLLGKGGMGEVYRARDAMLKRDVALKVLPSPVLHDTERVARFQREAEVLASLDHPNIGHIYGIAVSKDARGLVLALIEGPTLADRIAAGLIPLDEALAISKQIVEALEYAHDRGIVHRDLKPANIKITPDGIVKVLDFGLAKVLEDEPPPSSLADSPTLTVGHTRAGIILGTAVYMSPEQAVGRPVDRRSDIFSFGAVLYEMLTGKRAFAGATTPDVLEAVVKSDPDWTNLPAGTPQYLRRLLERTLAKDRKQRLQAIGEARIALDHPHDPVQPSAQSALAVPGRRWVPWAALAVAVSAVAIAFWAGQRSQSAAPLAPSLKFTRITDDAGLTFEPTISPDGKLVVYASDRAGKGNLDLWLQQIGGSGLPVRLTHGAEDRHEPAFSPDGGKIAFRSEEDGGAIFTMAVLGGEPRLLIRGGRGPRWSPDGKQIAYWTGGRLSGAAESKVLVIPSGGGQPVDVSVSKIFNRYPVWSPDGSHLLLRSDEGSVWVVEPRESGAKRLLEGAEGASQFTFGNWWKGMLLGSGGGLKAIPVSTGSWKVTGRPIDLTPGLAGEAKPAASASGAIVFAGETRRANIWALPLNAAAGQVTGSARQLTRSASRQFMPALSADGSQVAYQTFGGGGILATDIATGKEKLIVPSVEGLTWPSFSPDGRRIAFSTSVQDPKAGKRSYPIFVADLVGDPPTKVCDDCGFAAVWSPDGRKLVWDIGRPRYIGITDVATKKSERLTAPAERGVLQASFSPDGRWILAEIEHGADRVNIVVAPYRDGAQIQPSEWTPLTDPSGFNSRPRWSPEGNRVYFLSDRDGFRCIWTIALHPDTKRSSGPATPIAHFHEAQRSITNIGPIGMFGLSVGRDKLVFNLGEITGNIWLAQ